MSSRKRALLVSTAVLLLISLAVIYVLSAGAQRRTAVTGPSESDDRSSHSTTVSSRDELKTERSAKLVDELASSGATVYEYQGRFAVCFGLLGPPFPINQKPELVEVTELDTAFDWTEPGKSPAEIENIIDTIVRLARNETVVYVDLARLEISRSRLQQFRAMLPKCKISHASEYSSWVPKVNAGGEFQEDCGEQP